MTDKKAESSPSRGGGTSRKLLEKRARRQERDASSRKSSNRTRIFYSAIFVTLVLAILVAVIYAISAMPARGVQPAVGAAQEVGERLAVEAGVHIAPPQRAHYATDPPTSGQHYSLRGQAPAPWGFYDHALEPEMWVHNLEHGGVVILYSCPLAATDATSSSCADDQRNISDFVSGAPKDALFQEIKIVATEYPVPGHRFAIVAWGWRLFMDTWDNAQAERFYEAHVDNGPERMP